MHCTVMYETVPCLVTQHSTALHTGELRYSKQHRVVLKYAMQCDEQYWIDIFTLSQIAMCSTSLKGTALSCSSMDCTSQDVRRVKQFIIFRSNIQVVMYHIPMLYSSLNFHKGLVSHFRLELKPISPLRLVQIHDCSRHSIHSNQTQLNSVQPLLPTLPPSIV